MKTITMLSTAIALSLATQVCLAQETTDAASKAEKQQAKAEWLQAKAEKQQANTAKKIEKLMARFDINEDGQITLDEVQSLRVAQFNQMDVDGNGFVSVEEVKAAIALKKEQRLEDIFNKIDTDGDGVLSLAEFKDSKKKPLQKELAVDEPNDDSNAETRRGKRGAENKAAKQSKANRDNKGKNNKGKNNKGNNKAKQKKGKKSPFDFKRLDNDKDGQISLEEFTVNVPLFDKFDANEDGVLTVEELTQKRHRK
ncbi:EF-hand domain-containing protein [Candidatus Parabeggiatoa sp. HSG14]|uniref:EF-hand domain-containing protein n=1 Tax=Candidatus Parabeggiatoa sp. HSG14 TaxID=3055593 RepID=UPI0025A6F5BF|nr:EF-hand domain-containing protein [Thiotrichales bacterium HSG14]